MDISSGDCLIGSELEGNCSGNLIRIDIKRKIIILSDYNHCNCVLEGFSKCKINRPSKLSNINYLKCLQVIREHGYQPKINIGDELRGKEISCEFEKHSEPSRNWIIMKGRIALGVLNKPFFQSKSFESVKDYKKSAKFKLNN